VLLSADAVKDKSGKILHSVSVQRDITEIKKAEELRSELASIVESSNDAIIGKTLDGTITSWNIGAERIYGYTSKEAKGRHISLLLSPDRSDEVSQILERIKRGERVRDYETERVRKDGSKISVSLSVSSIKDADGKIVGISTIAHDITNRKRMEEALRESNRMKDLFIDVIDHDLINKVSVIRGIAEIMKDEELPEEARNEVNLIEDTAKKLEELIRNATSLSRLEAVTGLTTRKVDLVPMVSRAIEELNPEAEKKKIDIQFNCEGGVIASINVLMEEVFLNLISNAIKYSPRGGKVIVELSEDGDFFRFRVADCGEGIPEEHKESVFLRFHRAHRRGISGSGLGLAIVKRVVDLHQGRVWVEDDPRRRERVLCRCPPRPQLIPRLKKSSEGSTPSFHIPSGAQMRFFLLEE